MADIGQSLDDIDAVFITHDHSDHCSGLKGLCKLEGLKVFASYQTSCAAQAMMPESKIPWQIVQAGSSFQFNDLRVSTFTVPHDAYETVGYLVSTGDGSPGNPVRSVAWMTDLGHVPPRAAAQAAKADILVIEANHDLRMLENSARPFHTKQRIRGQHGHLSNEQTLAYLRATEGANWKHIYLAHISNECNDTELVRKLFGSSLRPDGTCPISVVHPRLGCPDIVELGPWKRENPDPVRSAVAVQGQLFPDITR